MPTNGTASPPVPHANPIISDDTVAALTGANWWPKVTFTGKVDCRKNPPAASTARNSRVQQRRGDEERDRCHQRQRDDAPRPESIRERPACEPADAAGEEVERDRCRRTADRHAPPGQHHRYKRGKTQRRQRPQHDDEIQHREVKGVRAECAKASVSGRRVRFRQLGHAFQAEPDPQQPRDRDDRAPVQPHPLDDGRKQQRSEREPRTSRP